MKILQELKNRLHKFKFRRLQNNEKAQHIKPITFITKSFSDDEDLFMFI